LLAHYRAQEWEAAGAALEHCRGQDESLAMSLAGLWDLYAERIAYYRAAPPGPDWRGVFVAETK
jgi:adenylate cyclase